MIDYKDDLSIRLGVALSDNLWTPPALTSQRICENVLNMQGERMMLSSPMPYALIFRSPLFPGSRWNAMKGVFLVILDHFIASLTLWNRYDWGFNICKNPRTHLGMSHRFYDRGCQQSSQSEVVLSKQVLYIIFLKLPAFPFPQNPSERLFALHWDKSLSAFVSKVWRHL